MRNFVSEVLGTDSVFMSDEDIEPGEKSLEEIDSALKRSTAALVIVSARSARDPWLNFEAGAMGVRLEKARVVPILLDLEFSQLIQPLAQFQGIRFDNREKFNQMLRVLNNQRGDSRIKSETLNIVFDSRWVEFVNEVQREIAANAQPGDLEALPDESDKIDEILSTIRRMSNASANQSTGRKASPSGWMSNHELAQSATPSAASLHTSISDVVPLEDSMVMRGPNKIEIEATSRAKDVSFEQRAKLGSFCVQNNADLVLTTKNAIYSFKGSDGTWTSSPHSKD